MVKFLRNGSRIALDTIGFLALMVVLLWLLNPVIPGVHLHGFWNFLLGSLGMLGFYELAKWIHKSGQKKASIKAP
jgi:hypothetical protein